ncbi:MAG: phosphoribosylaminoimidazolesuccinocarboxamide synthase [Deltaproteobacteria bacterium]|nr:phosphoribosylaminoimidazolesuccinocarboxamide synthase [Deltaproteobacteria bacterium]
MATPIVLRTDFPDLKLHSRGKVRDIYEAGEHLLIVTTDRMSAFDVIMNEGIPGKGEVLTRLSRFWFEKMKALVPNHLVAIEVDDFPVAVRRYRDQLEGRSMLVKKARPLPVECVARGYLAGSGWKEYRERRTVCGIPLPAGLQESSQLPEPIFTPSTKAEIGHHDENIPFSKAEELCGKERAAEARDLTLAIYGRAAALAEGRGILIADTKFEFGLDADGKLIWIDEALTPDSSRFWPLDGYRPGGPQPSFDKQFLRDYLETLDWDKQAPPPPLPPEIIRKTSEKYREALEKLTGIGL